MRTNFLWPVLFIVLFSCKPEEHWRETARFPSGETRILERYTVEHGDTVVTGMKVFYKNGHVFQEGDVKEHEKHGLWKAFYEEGQPWSETKFRYGLADGPSKTWYKNGQIRYTGFFKAGEKTGTWYWYNEKGELNKKIELGDQP